MFIDQLGLVSENQAFVAGGAVSTNSIDTGTASRDVGRGEPTGFGFSIAAAAFTTLLVEIISATDAALTTGILAHVSRTFAAVDVPAGARHFILLPAGAPTQRFLGVRVTPVGGAATVTLDAWYSAQSMFGVVQRLTPTTYTP